MAQSLIADEILTLLQKVGAAALAGVREVAPDWEDESVVVSVDEPPAGEICESINVWLEGLIPIQDTGECSLIWDADIRVRLDICGGFENPDGPLRTAEERLKLTTVFLSTYWAMLAGLTRAWREGSLPGDNQCGRVTWGTSEPSEDEGGWLLGPAQLFIEVSPRWVES